MYTLEIVEVMKRGNLDNSLVLCKVELLSTWIKRREEVNRPGKNNNTKRNLTRSDETKIEWDEPNEVEHMLDWVKLAIFEHAIETCGFVWMRRKNQKGKWRYD